jgi:hypothetical protein
MLGILAIGLLTMSSALFDGARFADITKSPSGVITARVGVGVDVVGTITDDAGALSYEQHPVMLKGSGVTRPLSPAERASLATTLEKYLSSHASANPLFLELLDDTKK